MARYIELDALLAEIEKRLHKYEKEYEELAHYEIWITAKEIEPKIKELKILLSLLNTLEVIDPYEQHVQYDSIKSGIQAQAETYSFNIESELYNQQTTKEGQKLWRKEIEQAFIVGGEVGVELAKDPRYKENLEVKDVDLEKEIDRYYNIEAPKEFEDVLYEDIEKFAKHFFELGMQVSNNAQKEPVSEDLEKAAVEAFKQIVDSDKNSFLEIFKAGAKWKEQQMMKEAIDAELDDVCGFLTISIPYHNGIAGDKVKVIIIKSE